MENNACDSENSQLNEATALTTTSNTNSDNAVGDDAISSTTSDKFVENASSSSNCDAEADFLEAELSISNVRSAKITENVEDIVQDLENLLGESADSYRFENSRNESCTEVNSTQEVPSDKLYDNLQSELQLCELSPQEVTSAEKDTEVVSAVSEIQESENVDSVDSGECEIEQSNSSVGESCVPESVTAESPEISDSNISESVDNVPVNFDNQLPEIAVTNIPEIAAEILEPDISTVDNETSEAVAQSSATEATEGDTIEEVLQIPTEMSEVDMACKNIQMEVDNVEEKMPPTSLQTEDSIAVASIMEDVEHYEEEASSIAVASIMSAVENPEEISSTAVASIMPGVENTEATPSFAVESIMQDLGEPDVAVEPMEVATPEVASTVEDFEDSEEAPSLAIASIIQAIADSEELSMPAVASTMQSCIVDVEDSEEATIVAVASIMEDAGDSKEATAIAVASIMEDVGDSKEAIAIAVASIMEDVGDSKEATAVASIMEDVEDSKEATAVASIMEDVGDSKEATAVASIMEDVGDSKEATAVASIMEDVGDSKEAASVAVASTMHDPSAAQQTLNELTESIPESIEQPTPDTSSDIVTATEPPTENTELRKPLTVEVEEPNMREQSKKEEITDDVTVSSTDETDRAPLKMTITKSENVHSILKIYDPNESQEANIPEVTGPHVEEESLSPQKETTSSVRQAAPQVLSPLKITIQNIRNDSPVCVPSPGRKSSETYSPRITIKPIVKPVYQESILKSVLEDKLILPEHSHTKSMLQAHLERHSPKVSDHSTEEERPVKVTIKPVLKALDDHQGRYSPKITIKPIAKPSEQDDEKSAKITIKSIPKMEEHEMFPEERHSPKITIKPIRKPEEPHTTKLTIKPLYEDEEHKPNPKITIKPIVKPLEDFESAIDNQRKITVKPVVKQESDLYLEERHSPKITIKPILRPDQFDDRHTKLTIRSIPKSDIDSTEGRHSPKITIKPIRPPEDMHISLDDHHSSKLIIRAIPPMQKLEETEEKAPRITIKPVVKSADNYASESGLGHRFTIKPIMKPQEQYEMDDPGQGPFKLNIKPIPRPSESSSLSPKITIKAVPRQEPASQMELIDFEDQIKQERIVLKIPKNRTIENERVNKIKVKLSKEQGIAQILPVKRMSSSEGMDFLESKYIKTEIPSDLSISLVPSVSEANKTLSDVNIKKEEEDIVDPLSEIPVFEITLESASVMNTAPKSIPPPAISIPPAPRKRGRPRKVPLEVREEFKDPKDETTFEVIESSRPKRSCRGTSVRATLGIRPRKPRGSGTRGRVGRPPNKPKRERRDYRRKSKDSLIPDFRDFDGEFKHVPLPIDTGNNIVMYEEETRMSAENSSRAHTPAKQVLTEGIDESQSSIQSNTTTESGEKLQKIRKGSRVEVHPEPEGEVISADKLAEYSWGGGGPYMLQEQVAQFLGIKSFKRKYPGIHRRTVDMQERDFIRESCLASEAMCDMGLTAVKSEDILDIMYTDFQHKYEEYCKHQRDRQAKDVSNKQKALSLAASQEKNKLDIVEQAVQSALQWNSNFNKTRKEQRRACLDLQTFTVHFPKGKMKQINKPPLGLYPVALVPGQYSDYYRKYNPLELGRLPLNTVGRKLISAYQDTEDSQSDASGSDSDSSSSDTDSSYSGSSIEDCKMCVPVTPAVKKMAVH